jgi:hypothetical protein
MMTMDGKTAMENLLEAIDMRITKTNRVQLTNELNNIKLPIEGEDPLKEFDTFVERFDLFIELLTNENGDPYLTEENKIATFISKLNPNLMQTSSYMHLLPDMNYAKLVENLRNTVKQKCISQNMQLPTAINKFDSGLHNIANYTNNNFRGGRGGRRSHKDNHHNNKNFNYNNYNNNNYNNNYSYRDNRFNSRGGGRGHSGRGGRGYNNRNTHNYRSKLQHMVQHFVHNIIRNDQSNNNNYNTGNNNESNNTTNTNNNNNNNNAKNIINNKTHENSNKKCHACGEVGHIQKYCPDANGRQNTYNNKGERRFAKQTFMTTTENNNNNIMDLNTGCNIINNTDPCYMTNEDINNNTNNIGPTMFIVDTGSSRTHCIYKQIFNQDTFKEKIIPIQVADGAFQNTEGVGTLYGKEMLGEVYYTPSFKANLLSINQLSKLGYAVTFTEKEVIFTDKSTYEIKGKGFKIGDLFYIDIHNIKPLYHYTGRQYK